MRILIKLGGALLDDAEPRRRIAAQLAELAGSTDDHLVVVHGGGKQMTRYLAERGIESQFVNGLRVTTPDIIDAVVKVFAGSVNAELVMALRAAGARPVGLSGLAAGLVDAEVLNPDLGQVGRPVHSEAGVLEVLTAARYLPVVACIAGDQKGTIYNVNADQMAVACASAFQAKTLLFLTDVDGVKDNKGTIQPRLSRAEARALIAAGVATGGMRAKLEASIQALDDNVGEVAVAPGARPGIVRDILGGIAIGTRITP